MPGIATLGVLPGTSSDMEWFNDIKCVQTTTSTGDEKKVTTTLKIAEVAHNQPPSDSMEIQTRYKNYIFLIDNAKKEYVYNVMNTCIVFASPKLENYALLYNVKTNTKTYWILVWSSEEISQFQDLLPEAFPVGENNDIAYLLLNFGGTIGNMTHKDRKSRFKHFEMKCYKAATNSVLATVICQENSDVIAEYFSLVENEVTEDHELAGMKYVSSFVTQEIMRKYLLGQRLTFAQFWNDCVAQAPGEYSKIDERHLPFLMSKGDKLKIQVAPFEERKTVGYFNNWKEVTMNFNDYVFKKANTGRYCIEVGHLVQM